MQLGPVTPYCDASLHHLNIAMPDGVSNLTISFLTCHFLLSAHNHDRLLGPDLSVTYSGAGRSGVTQQLQQDFH